AIQGPPADAGPRCGSAREPAMSQAAETAPKREQKPAAPLADGHFDWQDPLDLDGELTHEERMVRDTARGYAQDKLFPRVLTAYREECLDSEIVTELGSHGHIGD